MDVLDWTTFKKRIFIDTDIQTVYNAWTKSEEIEKWFLKKSIFLNPIDNTIIPKDKNVISNSKYTWNWFAQNHSEDGVIIKANSKDLLQFSFAGNCIVEIAISKTENGTLVELTQKDIPTDLSSKQNIRLGCAFGWTFYLLNLKSILEGGIDLRNKDINLSNIINN